MYSRIRYIHLGRETLFERIKAEMGNNALPFNEEYVFDTHEFSFKKYSMGKGKKIPVTRGFIRKIWKLNPDVIITEGFYQWTPLVILYSLLRNKPVYIGYERTCHTERNAGVIKKIHRKITNLFVTGYFVNGQETRKYLLSLGVKKEKIHIGGMNADSKGLVSSIETFPESERNRFRKKYDRGGVIFLFSGQIIIRKGLNYLLSAWMTHVKMHPHDTLIVIGDGDLREKLENEYKYEETVFFDGCINYNDVYKYYSIADVFVLPTIEDNWSLVIPEAMACGLPVATSIYNGCYLELVKKDVNGITFDTFKEDTIVKALDYFHHKDLTELGTNSVLLEQPFSTDNCAQRVFDVINNKYKKSK